MFFIMDYDDDDDSSMPNMNIQLNLSYALHCKSETF